MSRSGGTLDVLSWDALLTLSWDSDDMLCTCGEDVLDDFRTTTAVLFPPPLLRTDDGALFVFCPGFGLGLTDDDDFSWREVLLLAFIPTELDADL